MVLHRFTHRCIQCAVRIGILIEAGASQLALHEVIVVLQYQLRNGLLRKPSPTYQPGCSGLLQGPLKLVLENHCHWHINTVHPSVHLVVCAAILVYVHMQSVFDILCYVVACVHTP